MDEPGSPGEILRALARSYRDEVGPARAEQLVSRAMARAAEPVPRFKGFGALAASAALAVSVLALGLIVLVNSDPAGSDPDPVDPVASDPVSTVSTPEVSTLQTPTLPKEELEKALNLLEQQREMEAAEVVVRALSSMVIAVVGPEDPDVLSASPAPAVAEEQQDRPNASSVVGVVPPEQSTYADGSRSDEARDPETETTEADATPPQQDGPTSTTSDLEPSIEELGQVLRVEVEELLSADPQNLAEEAEDARNAAQQIQDYGGEPTIMFPSDGEDE